MIRASSPFRNIAAAMILLALALRVIIPSGFMPSSERGFALTICTGMDTQTVWMDKSGKLHKEDPSKGKSVEHQPCAFAGAAMAADVLSADFQVAMAPVALAIPVFAKREVSVGAGLAAPPPPAIGPPSYV
ncbi:MAG TPA: hypothetical protein PLJ45_01165 [Sphingorhabdus sp.]|uniref:hypothetical protein n=2 Tax=Sphingorhabdus sp. TaxID=1902408 RepID=UPI002B8C93D5|nr:hypothetical protein [Sphingorhabdus sp.]HQS78887.1 hypothetical protein [Sphingorhabdus sp.]